MNWTLTITARDGHALTEDDHIEIADILGDSMGVGTVDAESVKVKTPGPLVSTGKANMLHLKCATRGYSLSIAPSQ